MIRICSACPEGNNVLGHVSPLANKAKTHGYCRFHELEALEKGDLIEPEEKRELTAIRFKRLRQGIAL